MLIATEFVLIYVPVRLVFVSAKIENYLEKSKSATRFRLFVLSQYLYVTDSASVDCRFAVDPNRYAADSRGCGNSIYASSGGYGIRPYESGTRSAFVGAIHESPV